MQAMMLLFFMPLFLLLIRDSFFNFLLLLDNDFSLFWLLYVMIIDFWGDLLLLEVRRLIVVFMILFYVLVRL